MTDNLDLILILAYVIPLAIMAGIFLKEQVSLHTKWIIVALLPLAYIAHYHSLYSFAGWPVKQVLPDEFDLIAQKIEEPNKKANSPGRILMWIQGVDDHSPRVHHLPYSKKLHKKLEEVQKAQSEGKQQKGKRQKSAQGTAGKPEEANDNVEFSGKPQSRPPAKT